VNMDRWRSQEDLRSEVAVVVPVYFSAQVNDETVTRLLYLTVADLHHVVPPEQVWLVVDGDARSARLMRQVLDRLPEGSGGMQLIANEYNRGKLAVIRQGICEALSAASRVRYLAIIDGDADHLPAALPGLVRAADSIADAYGHERVITIGARSSRTRPMGWVRGELETLLDQLTADALAYALARQGRALDLSQCLSGRVPDLSSGYKVYLREMAEFLFERSEPDTGTLSDSDYWHYGPETVTIVEAVLAGAVIGEMLRPTWDGQPVTSFGEFGPVRMYGELLTWVWNRLSIPVEVAAVHLANRGQIALGTAREGAELLEQLRAHALGRLAAQSGTQIPAPRPTLPFI